MGISLLEISVGLVLSGVVALIAVRGLSSIAIFRARAFQLLPLTYLIPIALPLFLIHFVGFIGSGQTTVGIASLSFFPMVQALWGLRDRPVLFRILLAVDEALPYAFVAMFFGEAMSSIVGWGFFSLGSRYSIGHIAEGIAAALLSAALLIILSFALRWTAKRIYFGSA